MVINVITTSSWEVFLCDFLNVFGGDGDFGCAEEVEGDSKAGAVAFTDDLAFESCKLAANNTDAVAQVERGGGEGDGTVGIVEHEAEHVHLAVGDDSEGMSSKVVGMTRFICQEVLDEGKLDDFAAFALCHVNENEVGDEHALDLLFLSGAPDAYLILSGYIGFVA